MLYFSTSTHIHQVTVFFSFCTVFYSNLVEKLVHTHTNLVLRESLDDTLRQCPGLRYQGFHLRFLHRQRILMFSQDPVVMIVNWSQYRATDFDLKEVQIHGMGTRSYVLSVDNDNEFRSPFRSFPSTFLKSNKRKSQLPVVERNSRRDHGRYEDPSPKAPGPTHSQGILLVRCPHDVDPGF